LTDDLVREGAEIHFITDLAFIKDNFPELEKLLVIYTPAIPENHIELEFFRKGGYQILKRAEMLGILSSREKTIAVAGTHGKTTISTMIAHLLKVAGISCNAFLGGISKNYQTNALLSDHGEWMVLEADEYDRSFLNLYPHIAIITSCDPDHLDIYGSEEKLKEAFCDFIGQIKPGGELVVEGGIELPCLDEVGPARHVYRLKGKAPFVADDISFTEGRCRFSAHTPYGNIKELELGIPGIINIENALACICLGKILKISDEDIREALSSFAGVRRRFDIRVQRDDMVYIDDYAHHPRELKACIESVRENFPGRSVTGIFQPHLYSRTRDFADGFAASLSLLDELILLDIYPAREVPLEGVTSKLVFDKVNLDKKILIEKEQLIMVLAERQPDLLLTLGAGDIDQLVDPIIDLYSENKQA
jgi:UDP-N-acetylmuramate--alanine ligase